MDILEIVKINRLSRAIFAAKTNPKQRELVKFFDDYTLHSGDDNDHVSDNSVFSDDNAPTGPEERGSLVGTSLALAD